MDRKYLNPATISDHGPKCYCSIPLKCLYHFKEDNPPHLGLVKRATINTVVIKFHDDKPNGLISGGCAEKTEEPNRTEANAPQLTKKLKTKAKKSKSRSAKLNNQELDAGYLVERYRDYYAKLFDNLELSSKLNSSPSKQRKLDEKDRDHDDDDFEYFIPKSNISPTIGSLKINGTYQPSETDRVKKHVSVVRNLCDEFNLLCKTKSIDASQNDEMSMQIENTDTETRIKENSLNHNQLNICISSSGSQTRDLFQYEMNINRNVNDNIEECYTKELNLFGSNSPPYSSISDSSSPMMEEMNWSRICSTLGIIEDTENVTATKDPIFKKPFPIDNYDNNKPSAVTLLPSSRDTRCSTQELFRSQCSPSERPSLNFNTSYIEHLNDSLGLMSVEVTDVKNVNNTCGIEKVNIPQPENYEECNVVENLTDVIAKNKLVKSDKEVSEITENKQGAANYGVILFEEECVDNPFRKQIQPNYRTDCDSSQNEVASSYVTIPSSIHGPSHLSLNRKQLKCSDDTLIHSVPGVHIMNFTHSKMKNTQLKKKKRGKMMRATATTTFKRSFKKRIKSKLEHRGYIKRFRL